MEALIGLAAGHHRLGEPGEARRHADQALAIARDVGYGLLTFPAASGCGDAMRTAGSSTKRPRWSVRACHRLGQCVQGLVSVESQLVLDGLVSWICMSAAVRLQLSVTDLGQMIRNTSG